MGRLDPALKRLVKGPPLLGLRWVPEGPGGWLRGSIESSKVWGKK